MKKDRLVIVDIEATCWPNKYDRPFGEESEIIEIGVCSLDLEKNRPLEKDSILVRPERSTVSRFCEDLTTLTQDMVDTGVSFPEACEILRERHGTDLRVWGSYGAYDRRMFEQQCEDRGVKYPFGPKHLNVKSAVAEVFGMSRGPGMAKALRMLNLRMQGTHHRGDDDAWNIANMLAELIRRSGGLKQATFVEALL